MYTPLLYFWVRRLGLRGQDADDLVQDVFLVLVRKLPGFTYDPQRSFRSWLRTVVVNTWRGSHRRAGLPWADCPELEGVAGPDTTDALEEAEYRNYLVGRALRVMQAEFEPTTWKACWEYAVQGRPPAEVAEQLGVSIAVVYSAKCRVLRRLRQELEGLFG